MRPDEGVLARGALWTVVLVVLVAVALVWVVVRKNSRFTTGEVFRASRWTRGNHLFPTQVSVTPTSVIQHTPQWLGKLEESIHISHVASTKIDTGLLWSDVIIETTGGSVPIVCHGHRKQDAVRIKGLIEQYQTEYYRPRRPG